MTSCARSRAPHLLSKLPTCVFTVGRLMHSRWAISMLESPLAISMSTSLSRPVIPVSSGHLGRGSVGWLANSAISRRVTVGSSTFARSATCRIARRVASRCSLTARPAAQVAPNTTTPSTVPMTPVLPRALDPHRQSGRHRHAHAADERCRQAPPPWLHDGDLVQRVRGHQEERRTKAERHTHARDGRHDREHRHRPHPPDRERSRRSHRQQPDHGAARRGGGPQKGELWQQGKAGRCSTVEQQRAPGGEVSHLPERIRPRPPAPHTPERYFPDRHQLARTRVCPRPQATTCARAPHDDPDLIASAVPPARNQRRARASG